YSYLLNHPPTPESYTLSLHDALPILENWSYATAASKGPIARRYPYNYQQALGHAQPYDGLAGALVTDGEFGETNALTLYGRWARSEEHTSELQSRGHLVCRLLLEKKK